MMRRCEESICKHSFIQSINEDDEKMRNPILNRKQGRKKTTKEWTEKTFSTSSQPKEKIVNNKKKLHSVIITVYSARYIYPPYWKNEPQARKENLSPRDKTQMHPDSNGWSPVLEDWQASDSW